MIKTVFDNRTLKNKKGWIRNNASQYLENNCFRSNCFDIEKIE